MRRVIIGMALCVAIAAVPVMAGDYHRGTTLNCAECHVMHSSQQHGLNSNGGGNFTTIGPAPGTYDYLLRNEVNELCLTCHDNQTFAPDVLEENGGTQPTTGRQAGALNNGSSSNYFHADGHTLGSTDVAPGGTFSNANGLECTDCHAAHGRGTTPVSNPYRNLRTTNTATSVAWSMSYTVGVADPTKDVYEANASGSDHYDVGNVNFYERSQDSSMYGQVCQACHIDFHGNASSSNMRNQLGPAGTEWLRHPTAGANVGALGGGHSSLTVFKNKLYRPKVMSASGDWGTQGVAWAAAPADLSPSCFSCHKGHGNKRSFGLIYPTGNAPISEEGDGTLYKELCKACHTQG
jgi:hypothetical protein